MAENSKIEWCDHTFNCWIGCTKASQGCANCFAERTDNQRKWTPEGWGKGKPRKRTSVANWKKPITWNKQEWAKCLSCDWRGKRSLWESCCPKCQGADWGATRQRVFCASLADVFDKEVDQGWRLDLFDLIEDTPNLDWLVLTKRPENIDAMIPASWRKFGIPENVWLGTSIENQEWANKLIPEIVQYPRAWLSIEPLLGPITFDKIDVVIKSSNMMLTYSGLMYQIKWIIVGGESGYSARPMHPDWPRALRDECKQARLGAPGIPYLFKQHGAWKPLHPQYGNTDSFDKFDDLESHPNRDHAAKETICIGNDGEIYQHWKNGKEEYFCGYQPPPATNPWWMGRIGAKEDDATLDGIVCQQFPEDEIE